jgi:hypothetical protein
VSKRLVTQLFVGSLLAAVGEFVVLVVAGGLAWGGGVFLMRGPEVVGVQSTPTAWVALGQAVLGTLVLLAPHGRSSSLGSARSSTPPACPTRCCCSCCSPVMLLAFGLAYAPSSTTARPVEPPTSTRRA